MILVFSDIIMVEAGRHQRLLTPQHARQNRSKEIDKKNNINTEIPPARAGCLSLLRYTFATGPNNTPQKNTINNTNPPVDPPFKRSI